jgi:hypothetical protein
MKRLKRKPPSKVRLRKHLNADALIGAVRREFEMLPEPRFVCPEIPVADVAMSAFAMFSLKDPSLLAFEKSRTARDHNLRSIYKIGSVPSDTTMRDVLDEVPASALRPAYRAVFRHVQRGKALEQMAVMDGYHLLALDGTTYFSSDKLCSGTCLQKNDSRSGKTIYQLQMMGAALVHPDFKEVIPLVPEPIRREDGGAKNDCERNAAKRLLEKLRVEHPHLKMIATEDALSPNGPHIDLLKELDYRFILSVKPADHVFLWEKVDEAVEDGRAVEFDYQDPNNPDIRHYFRFANDLPLNKSRQDLRVNFLEYWQDSSRRTMHFSWVTDFAIMRENAYTLMRCARAEWKIENETFNTLKNQGYHFDHNFGLGKNHLSTVFPTIMMLAFLVDQVQQLCCSLFRAAWEEIESKKLLWERMRALFYDYELESMGMIFEALVYGYKKTVPKINYDSS